MWDLSRTWQCAGLGGTYTEKVGGKLTGSATFVAYNYVYTNPKSNMFGNQLEVRTSTVSGTAVGKKFTLTPACSGACTLDKKVTPTGTLRAGSSAKAESYWKTTATAKGAKGTATSSWTLNVGGTAPSIIKAPHAVRCDNALGNGNVGCVIPGRVLEISYPKTLYPQFTAHVTKAQASGLPGGTISRPLNRLQDAAAQDRNRNTACKSKAYLDNRPVGTDCDEYPFASTKQGAALSGGGPRTFAGCHITLPAAHSTGGKGYSICLINSSQNRNAGTDLNNVLFVPLRVLDGDPFIVTFR